MKLVLGVLEVPDKCQKLDDLLEYAKKIGIKFYPERWVHTGEEKFYEYQQMKPPLSQK